MAIYLAHVDIDGSVGPLFPQPNAQIELSFNVDDLSTFSAITGKPLSQLKKLGALQLDGKIIISDQSLKLDSIKIGLEKLGLEAEADATIKDISSFSGIETNIEVNLDSLSQLTLITESELPETGPWNLNVHATTQEVNGGPVTISTKLIGEGITTQADVTVPDVTAPSNINAKLSMDAESLSKFGFLFNNNFWLS